MGKRIPDHELGLPEYFNGETETESEDSDSDNQYSSNEEECDVESEEKIKLIIKDETKIEVKSIPVDIKCIHKYSKKEEDEFDYISTKVKGNLKLTPDSSSSIEKIDDDKKSTDDCQVFQECEIILTPIQDVKSKDYSDKMAGTIKKLNLDVTALIAYVTATANGGANYIFKDKFLTEQAKCERYNPVKETLDGYFEGKDCCIL